MKIVLAAPFLDQNRGNTVTAKRIAEGLKRKGIDTKLISITDERTPPSLQNVDLVHGFNAYRFFQYRKRHPEPIQNYVITLTGTDVNHDLYNDDRKEDVIACLRDAKAIHVFDDGGKKKVVAEAPELAQKVTVVPQAASEFHVKDAAEHETNSFTFLLPAGIRKVKNVPFAIHTLSKLRADHPELKLVLVGPILEEAEGKVVQELAMEHDWIEYLGELPHEEMGSLYHNAHVILNTSHSEGQPSSVLEAMSMSKPVLVSNNSGNQSIVTHEETGLIYENEQQFLTYANRLMKDPSYRKQLGLKARNYIKQHHDSDKEADTFLRVYQDAIENE